MEVFCPTHLDNPPQIAGSLESNFNQLSHDLRTPLNHINGFAELLLSDEGLSTANAEYARAIISGGKRLNDTVISYLDGADPHRASTKTQHGTQSALCAATQGARPQLPVTAELRPDTVMGPLGQPMSFASLPPPDTTRWIAQRKAELVAAVEGGLLTLDEVCERYRIELEEFVSWQRGLERGGMRGLFVKRMQKDRKFQAGGLF